MTGGGDRWRRIEAICQAALEQPAGERPAFVRQACGDDDSLRGEAEALVAKASAADGGGVLHTSGRCATGRSRSSSARPRRR